MMSRERYLTITLFLIAVLLTLAGASSNDEAAEAGDDQLRCYGKTCGPREYCSHAEINRQCMPCDHLLPWCPKEDEIMRISRHRCVYICNDPNTRPKGFFSSICPWISVKLHVISQEQEHHSSFSSQPVQPVEE